MTEEPTAQNILGMTEQILETYREVYKERMEFFAENPTECIPKLSFVRTHPDAVLPKKNYSTPLHEDAGLDVTAVEDKIIPARGAAVVNVGLQLGYLTPGFWIRIESRSGLQFKHSISAFNGIIDNSYRGDMGVRLINSSDVDYEVKKGDRVAQFVLYMNISSRVEFIDTPVDTERGAKGFGSSGK
jgi:dUTP pyrophosphatase